MTWTLLYDTIFGPTGTSSCTKGTTCHEANMHYFRCGTSASACYDGLRADALVSPGGGASLSRLVGSMSPLKGVGANGKMPEGGTAVTAAQITQIKSWLADGAPKN